MLYAILDSEFRIQTYLNEDNLYMLEELQLEECYKLAITEELWQYLISSGQCKLLMDLEEREYTIEDKDLFEDIQIKSDNEGLPTIMATIKSMGEELSQEKLKGIQKDNTIAQLGQELANVKLEIINMKGGN